MPSELQVHILTYLRAFDLSAVQQTCTFYNNSDLIDNVVTHMMNQVYTPKLTQGVYASGTYTLGHLRNMELTVIARLLSSPEPKTGFYVSKSWIKKTLLWLDKINSEQQPSPKKLTKKQIRQRQRRLSDISPPWPNVNSDLLCTHQNLQRCGVKSARSRRRLMDKQAWKILKKLYPDSTQLESVQGECLQCLVETETLKRNEQGALEQAKLERKKPLDNFHVRRLYTRTRGVPTHCVKSDTTTEGRTNAFPLVEGTYYIIPRVWCHQWRRYIKTGEGGMPPPPEASVLLCDAHRLALLPPHLEAYLGGQASQLLATTRGVDALSPMPAAAGMGTPVGVRPNMDAATVNALMAAGISPAELATQQMAMLQLEQQQQRLQQQQVQVPLTPTRAQDVNGNQNDLLDRENHIVVELVTENEWIALQETGCWPRQQPASFFVSITVTDGSGKISLSTAPCQHCDNSGSASSPCISVKNRTRGRVAKSAEKPRAPPLEF
jgi:hypothetical protein